MTVPPPQYGQQAGSPPSYTSTTQTSTMLGHAWIYHAYNAATSYGSSRHLNHIAPFVSGGLQHSNRRVLVRVAALALQVFCAYHLNELVQNGWENTFGPMSSNVKYMLGTTCLALGGIGFLAGAPWAKVALTIPFFLAEVGSNQS